MSKMECPKQKLKRINNKIRAARQEMEMRLRMRMELETRLAQLEARKLQLEEANGDINNNNCINVEEEPVNDLIDQDKKYVIPEVDYVFYKNCNEQEEEEEIQRSRS